MARKVYEVAVDLKPYLHPLQPWRQQQQLPNLEEITDLKVALKEIGWRRQRVEHYNWATMLPPDARGYQSPYPGYVNLYAGWVSGGGWDGTGIILTTNEHENRVFRFALCKHEKTEEGHNPRPGRGWHPGHCKLCNMDMTVDSGD